MWGIFDFMRRTLRERFPWGSGSRSNTKTPPPINAELRDYLVANLHVAQEQVSAVSHETLVTLVEHHHQHKDACEAIAASWWSSDELSLELLLEGPIDSVLHYRPTAQHVAALRRNPDRLRAVIDHGLSQLTSVVDLMHWAEQSPPAGPIGVWLEAMCAGLRTFSESDATGMCSLDDVNTENGSMLTILHKHDVSAVCGYYFAESETGIHCFECTADTTCVMCLPCFRTSPCRHHKYRITSTTGGGMCDCGNPHMWKPESFCSSHGAHVTPQNPVDSLPESHQRWITETIRGLVHLVAIVLQVGLTFRKVPWTTPELIIGGPQLGKKDWMINWLSLASEQLREASECGDGTRRILTDAWKGKAHTIDYPFELLENIGFTSPRQFLTCLEILFLFDLTVGNDTGDMVKLRSSARYQEVMSCIANCLPDRLFRLPYAVHMCQYAEVMSNSSELGNLCVQVLNSVAVSRLMETPLPVHVPGITDTIVHRMLSSVLYLLTSLVDKDSPDFSEITGGEWMVPIVRAEQLSTFSLTFFAMCVGCSHEAALSTAVSRTCFRAFAALLLVIQCNSDIHKDPQLMFTTSAVSIPNWLGCAVMSEIWRIQLNTREILAALTDAHGSHETTFDFLALRPSVVTMLQASTRLDDPELSEQYTRMLAHCALTENESTLLLDGIDTNTPDAGFAFASNLMTEVMETLKVFLRVQRARLCHNTMKIVLHSKDEHATPVYEFELLQSGHGVSTANTSLTLASFVLRAWMMELGRRNGYWWSEEGHYSPSTVHSVRLRGTTPPPLVGTCAADTVSSSKTFLDLVHHTFSSVDDSTSLVGGILDALVMPFVLISQVEKGLWRRNDNNVSVITQTYLFSGTKCFLEGDIFLLQVLCVCIPAEDFALRILQRFTYPAVSDSDTDSSEREDDQNNTISGYSRYLRLLLTIIQDTSKSCNNTEFSQPAIHRTVAHLISGSRMQHSRVLHYVNNRVPNEFEGETIRGTPPGSKVETMVRQSLEQLTIGEHTNTGLQFRIKSTAVWRQYVDLYYPMVTDDSMTNMYEQYRSIETLEYLETTNEEKSIFDRADVTDGAPTTMASKVPQLPPTVLRTSAQFAELVPPTRALLHTDALLLPSFFVLHLFNENAKRRSRSEPDVVHIGEPVLVHAVTALYLCIQDCEEVSAALESDRGLSEMRVAQSPPFSGTTPINWPRVEAYLLDEVQRHRSFDTRDSNRYLPLPELAGLVGVRDKLQIPVSALRMPQSGFMLFETPTDLPALTTGQVLHEVRERYRAATEPDRFSVSKMIDHILLATGLAQFRPLEEEEDSEEEKRRREEAHRRQKHLRERQSKLLQRMRMRCAKAPTGAVAATTTTEEATQMLRPLRTHEQGYLHTKLLMDLATLECCVCRVISDEPLMMLAHTSTSGSLYYLRRELRDAVPGGRTSHGHFHVCGHAAHMTCIKKVYSRLARQWAGETFFEGRYYLGPSEFSCPMCMMICNTVCVCPALSSAATSGSPMMMAATPLPIPSISMTPAASSRPGDGTPGEPHSSPPSSPQSADIPAASGETLFEELRRCSVNPQSSYYRELTTRCDALFGSVAAANIGLNTSETAKPLVSQEDPLQKTHPDAWELAETIRCVLTELRLAVELSWIGESPTRKGMISILALLTSVYPARVGKNYTAIQQQFQSSNEGLSLLVLDCLGTPRRAAELIEQFVATLVYSSNEVYTVVERWLEADADANSASDEHHNTLVGLLRELLCLSLLKLLLVEEPAHLVLRNEGDKSSDCVAHIELETATAREDTLLRHLAYLLRCKVDPEMVHGDQTNTLGHSVRNTVIGRLQSHARSSSRPSISPSLALSEDVDYESPQQWAKHLLTSVLHQDDHYTQILTDFAKSGTCSQCGKVSKKPVMCCLCHRYFCLQPTDSAPELYAHTRSCCGGLGLYLVVRGTSYIFLDAVASRVGEYPSIYTDEFGETDNSLVRGVPLTRNDDDGMRLLTMWIANRWGVESRIVKQSYGGSLALVV